MCRSAHLIRTDKTLAVYELEKVSDISDAFLDQLAWPDGATQLGFRFKQPIVDVPAVLSRNLSKKYIAQIGYLARKDDLVAPASDGPASIELQTPDDLDALKTLTKRTLLDFLFKPWREFMNPDFPGEVDAFLAGQLSLASSAWLVNRDAHVGLINLMHPRDCLGRPVDHVAWIWLDERLPLRERIEAHRRLILWLKQNTSKPVQAFIYSFNVRSIRFFTKVGFKPACVHIAKHV